MGSPNPSGSTQPQLEAVRSCPDIGFRLDTRQFPVSSAASASAGARPFEQHYRPEELAKLWGLSANLIRDLFEFEPGVLKINRPEKLHKRRYVSLRIPASVAERVHLRLDARQRAA